jgi:hypothetical protein
LGDDAASPDALLAVARPHIERCNLHVEHVSADLAKGLRDGQTEFSDLRSSDLTGLFRVLSRRFPAVTFRVWGIGEESWDIWTREFLGGKITFRRGPFPVADTSTESSVVTLEAVAKGSLPILRVQCNRDGGDWTFLPAEGRGAPVYTVVSLGSLLQRDPSINKVLDLKPGWEAVRKKVGGPWVRKRLRAE